MTDQKAHLQSIGRVVAGVVDVQQTMAHHFDALCKGMEALKIEHKTGIDTLRDEIRRSDDRAQAQFAELNSVHNKEMERLHQIIQILITRDATPAVHPALQQHALAQMQQQQQHVLQQQQAAMQQALLLRQQMEMQQAHSQSPNNASFLAAVNAANAAKPPGAIVPPTFNVPPPMFKPQVPVGQTQPVSAVPKFFQPAAEVTIPAAVQPKPLPTPAVTVPAVPAVPAAAAEKKSAVATAIATPTPAPATATFSFGTKKPESSPVTAPPVLSPAVKQDEEDDENPTEYEPEAVFAPVCPLPDLVEVKTGEEEEEVVFNNRSKLYIYHDNKEWKERGTGELKVLLNKETKKYRVVMRRDQVFKVCANFPIVSSMSIQQMAKNEKAYTWFCEDFSEDEPAHVKLSARFSTVEIATEFKDLFEKAVAAHKGDKTIDKEIKPAEVKKEVKKEVKEEVVIPPNEKENGFGDKFKPKPGSWECKECYTSNKAETAACVCCGTNKDGTVEPKNIFSKPSLLQPAPGTPKVTFGFGASAQATQSSTPTSAFGASLNGSPSTANNSIFGGGTPKTSIFGASTGTPSAAPSFSFNARPPAGAPAATTTPTFNFNKPAAAPATSSQGNALFGGGAKTDAPNFFKSATETAAAPAAPKPLFSFGKPADSVTPAEKSDEAGTPKNIFGSFAGGTSFASLAAKSKDSPSIFDSANAQKAQAELASLKKTSVFGNKATPAANEKEDGDEEEGDGEYEPEVEFAPVCPLPELVEVKTGEEDEEVVFTARCKLYKYFSDLQENKERGVGDIKILKSKDNKYRIVMRREQVHKLCANFRIEKSMKMSPKPNLPQVLTFMCQDYSDDATTADPAIFTAKFKDEEIAKSFKEAVQDAQSKM